MNCLNSRIYVDLVDINCESAGEECNYGNIISTSFVHVDDVVRAHIHLFEHPDAKGRYLCTGVQFSIEELHELITARYPEYTLPAAE